METEESVNDDSSFETVSEENEEITESGETLVLVDKSVRSEKDDIKDDTRSNEKSVSQKCSEETVAEESIKSQSPETEEGEDPEQMKLIEQIQKLLQERKEMKKVNKNLQAKLSIFFKTKKIDLSPYDKEPDELEKDYHQTLEDIAKFENQLANFESDFKKEIEGYEKMLKEKEEIVQELATDFAHLKRSVALRAVDSQSGVQMTSNEVDHYLKQEEQRDRMLREIRLEYVKQNNALKEAEKRMEDLDSVQNSVNIIEFDQLGVQIQTFSMKIGQREEEIAKFQSQCSNTINTLSHYKEKLYFIQHEKRMVEDKLKNLEQVVKSMRDQLFILKAKQEATRAESHELQQKFKLLQNESLLEDFLVSKQKYNSLTEELEKLKKRYASAILSLHIHSDKQFADRKSNKK